MTRTGWCSTLNKYIETERPVCSLCDVILYPDTAEYHCSKKARCIESLAERFRLLWEEVHKEGPHDNFQDPPGIRY